MYWQRLRSHLKALLVTAVLVVLAAACGYEGRDATAPVSGALQRGSLASTASGGSGWCAAAPTVVVSTETALHAAVAAAQPGDVIAIEGTIALNEHAARPTAPDVTLTCATAGSGLTFGPAFAFEEGCGTCLVRALGDRDVVRGLKLDASGRAWAIFSMNTDGHRVEGNDIICGTGCGFWIGTTNAVVRDNTATTTGGATSGLHFQGVAYVGGGIGRGIDGTRIERNTVVALAPGGSAPFGGIRPRDGTGVVVSDNVVRGPWSNGISAVNLSSSELSRNVLEGVRGYGMVVNGWSPPNLFSRGLRVLANRPRDAALAGFLVNNACGNEFVGNPTLGATPYAFVLTTTTGANRVAGTAGISVDQGAYDCDGDGAADPNRVSGTVMTSLGATRLGERPGHASWRGTTGSSAAAPGPFVQQ